MEGEAIDKPVNKRARKWWRRAIHLIRSILSLFRRACNRGSRESLASDPGPARSENRRRAMEPNDSSELRPLMRGPMPIKVSSTSPRPRSFEYQADVHAAQSPRERSIASPDTSEQEQSHLSSNAPLSDDGSEQLPSDSAQARASSSLCEEIEIDEVKGGALISALDLANAIRQAIMAKSASLITGISSFGLKTAAFAMSFRSEPAPREEVTSRGEAISQSGAAAHRETVSLRRTVSLEHMISPVGAGLQGEAALPVRVISRKRSSHGEAASQEVISARREAIRPEEMVPDEEAGPSREAVPWEEAPPCKAEDQDDEDNAPGEAVQLQQKASNSEAFPREEAGPHRDVVQQEEAVLLEGAGTQAKASPQDEAVPEHPAFSSNSDSAATSDSHHAPAYSPLRSSSSGIGVSPIMPGEAREASPPQIPSPQISKWRHGSTASTNSDLPSLEMDTVSTSAIPAGSLTLEASKSPKSPPIPGALQPLRLGSPPLRTSSNLFGEGPSGLSRTQQEVRPPPLLRDASRFAVHSSPDSGDITFESTYSSLSSLSLPSDPALALAQSAVQPRKKVAFAPLKSPPRPDTPREIIVAPIVFPEEHLEGERQPHEGRPMYMQPDLEQPDQHGQNDGADPDRNNRNAERVRIMRNVRHPGEDEPNHVNRPANIRLEEREGQNHEEQPHIMQLRRDDLVHHQVVPPGLQPDDEVAQINAARLVHDPARFLDPREARRRFDDRHLSPPINGLPEIDPFHDADEDSLSADSAESAEEESLEGLSIGDDSLEDDVFEAN